MGNSNSTQHAAHQQQPLQWSQSLDPPDSRNRMKKGYFPPRHYIGHGHGGMVPPQKVLPAVNPAKEALRLKPTSNGAILHGGGTISGRKLQLLNELHEATLESSPTDDPSLQINRAIRKRHLSASSLVNGSGGSVIDPGELVDMNNLSGGTSTPNLSSMDFHASDFSRRSQRSISGHTIIFDKGSSFIKGGSGIGGSCSGRDYDSEPDMRDGGMTESVASTMGDRSVSPLPNSFTLISESPAKKQIRTKKKYQAPPPPPENMIMMVPPNGRPFLHDPMDPHFPPNMNGFNPNIHRASTNSNSSGAGPAGGKKKLTRLFKTKAQSKMSSASAAHQKQQKSHEDQDERRILAESIIIGQAGMSPSMKNNMNSNQTSYNSHNNNNSSSQWTSGSYNNEAQTSNHHSRPPHMGMTTTMTTSTEQLEKFRHNSPTAQKMHQANLKHSQMSEQQYSSSSAAAAAAAAEGRRLSSMSNELAAAAAALGKKKKPFAPLCSTKEDRDSPRGGAPLSQTQASLQQQQQQQQLPPREVISGREPVTKSMAPAVVSHSNNPHHLSPSHNIKTSNAAHSQMSQTQNHQPHSNSSNNNNNNNNSHSASHTQFSAQGLNVNKYNRRENENGNDGATKKTFYFGQDLGTSTSTVQEVLVSQSKQHNQGQLEQTSSDQNISNANSSSNNNNNKRVISSSTKPPASSPSHIIDKIKNNKSPPSPVGSSQDPRQQLKAVNAMNMNQRMNDSHNKSKFTNGNITHHSISEEPTSDSRISSSSNHNPSPANTNSSHADNEFQYKNKAQPGQKSSSHSRVETELKVTMQSSLNGKITSVMNQNKIHNQSKQKNIEEDMKQYPPPPPPLAFSNNSNSSTNKIIHNVISSSSVSNKNSKMNIQDQIPRSDSDSDGFHHQLIQQQHQNNMKQRQSKKKSEQHLTGVGVLNIGDSSSDLSSSEVDIPLLIRPTLPQRRLDLPRFSPSAAWRALDSPRASGRSLSSEDGFSYEDRIQRYTRPSAPPRNNNERSGDSGISAGDAGSPANAPDIGGRTSSCSYSLSNHNNNNPDNNSKLRKNKIRGSSPTKNNISDGKCWTPEQDLDESSSEFEHDVDLTISPLGVVGVSSSDDVLESNDSNNLVPIGLQTPPKFTTRSQLFAKNNNNICSPPFTSKADNHSNLMYNSNNNSGSSNRYNGNGSSVGIGNRFTGEPQSLQIHNLQRQHLYTRSTKANLSSSRNSPSATSTTATTNNNNPSSGNHSSIVEIIPDNCNDLNSQNGNGSSVNAHSNNMNGSRKLSRHPQSSSHESRQFERDQQQRHGFVGLDTNWFLSRSEPNLLRAQDATMESGTGRQSSRRIHPRLSVMQESPVSNEPLDFLDKVFPTKRDARARPRTGGVDHHQGRKSSSGCLENENLHFENGEEGMAHDEEQFSEDDNDLLMMGNGEVRSEIGYGPSSMNFYTSSAHQKKKKQQQQEPQPQPTNSPFYDEDSKTNSLILFRRPFSFSHIMYLPSYDSRRLHHPNASSSSHHYPNNRRTKSVDNLDTSSQLKLFRPSISNSNLSNSNDYFDFDEEHQLSAGNHTNNSSSHFQHQSRSRGPKSKFSHSKDQNSATEFNYNNHSSRKGERENNSQFNFSRSQSVPGPRVIEHKIIQLSDADQESTNQRTTTSTTLSQSQHLLGEKSSHPGNNVQDDQQRQQQIDQERRRQDQINEKKKKFKFQSTLRVLERKKIEKELTREAEEKEMQRLREIESMRRVEEEFQKKRAHKEQSVELNSLKDNHSKTEAGQCEEWNDLRLNGGSNGNNGNNNNSSSNSTSNKNIVRNINNMSNKNVSSNVRSGNSGNGRHFLNSNQDSNDDSCGGGGGGGGGRSSSATSGSKSMTNASIATTTTVSTNNTHHSSGSSGSGSGSNPHHTNRQRQTSTASTTATSANHHHHNDNSNIHGSRMIMSNSKLLLMAQRQEPEGAPAFSTTTDLRKELIHASRKRNGTGSTSTQGGSSSNGTGNNHHGPQHHRSGSSELTHELSEYRQETRQYCDYRRSPRTNSASPARFVESSNSDIFPLSRRTPVERSKQSRYRSTVHPEVVCDIPGKPFPFMVNFSRLSGSTSNLVMDERPGSGLGLGGGNTSGPSSIISDNYRRDWAHHIRGSGGSSHGGGGPGRASSVASLHSAPGYTPDHLRHSSTDLTIQADSPRVIHKSRKSPLFQKYSSSPPSSPLPPLSSNISEITDMDKDGSSIITSTNGPPSGVFQLQPFKQAKGYRPVTFKPPSTSNHAIKLTSTTVN